MFPWNVGNFTFLMFFLVHLLSCGSKTYSENYLESYRSLIIFVIGNQISFLAYYEKSCVCIHTLKKKKKKKKKARAILQGRNSPSSLGA